MTTSPSLPRSGTHARALRRVQDNHAKVAVSGRKSPVVHSAICTQEDGGFATITRRHAPTTGRFETLTARQKLQANKTAQVPCKPLRTILAEHGYPDQIDFLSVDVEGGEGMVLSTAGELERFGVVLIQTTPSWSVAETRRFLGQAGLMRAGADLYPHRPPRHDAMNDMWTRVGTRTYPVGGVMLSNKANKATKPTFSTDGLVTAVEESLQASPPLYGGLLPDSYERWLREAVRTGLLKSKHAPPHGQAVETSRRV